MIKCKVIEKFSLKDYNKLKNIVRAGKAEQGKLFVGDTFDCDEEMAKYLLNETKNPANRAFVKIIEVIPEIKVVNQEETIIKEEIKPKRPTRRRKTIAKKD